MSIRLINLALELELPPVPKLVLLVLADNANDKGFCWPSIRNIARRASVSERTVQRTIFQLALSKLIRVEARHRKNGSQASNAYYVLLEQEGGAE